MEALLERECAYACVDLCIPRSCGTLNLSKISGSLFDEHQATTSHLSVEGHSPTQHPPPKLGLSLSVNIV